MRISDQKIPTTVYVVLWSAFLKVLEYTPGVSKKTFTHFKRCYLCTFKVELNFGSKLNWIMVAVCSMMLAQKVALITWMLASPSHREDSQREWREHGCRWSPRPFRSGVWNSSTLWKVQLQWRRGYASELPTRLTTACIREKAEMVVPWEETEPASCVAIQADTGQHGSSSSSP